MGGGGGGLLKEVWIQGMWQQGFFHLVADRICNFLFCFGQDGFKVLTVVGFLGFVSGNEQQ